MFSRPMKALHAGIYWLRDSLTPRQFLLLSSVFVGISSGLAVILLKTFAHTVYIFARNLNQKLHFQYISLILPVIGLVLTVFIVQRFFKGKLEKGTWRIIYAINKGNSNLPRVQMFVQMITASITVGFGGSAGLESPVTITGAAFGSNYARTYRLNTKERTLLLACGVAAGIAAAFNAPIAGVLFTMEVLLADVGITAFIPLMMAAASGALVSSAILNESILLSFKSMAKFELSNIPFYLLFGVITGFISVYHSKMFNRIEEFFEKLKWNVYTKAIFGAVLLSILIIIFPSLFGEGYESIKTLSGSHPEKLLKYTFFNTFQSPWFLILFLGFLILAKAIATGITLGAGGNGGNFAPSLFVGSYAGFAFSQGWNLTGLTGPLPVANFTMVGMAGMLAGLFHAPLTAMFLIAEITGGYELMIPLMIVSSISFAISKRYVPHSMDIAKIAGEGHVVRADKDKHILSSISKEDILEHNIYTLNPNRTVKELFDTIQETHQAIFPVVTVGNQLVGMIHLDDLPEIIPVFTKEPDTTIDNVMERIIHSVTPQNTLEHVMTIFERSKLNYLAIIEYDQVVGYYSKAKLLEAYRRKIMENIVE